MRGRTRVLARRQLAAAEVWLLLLLACSSRLGEVRVFSGAGWLSYMAVQQLPM